MAKRYQTLTRDGKWSKPKRRARAYAIATVRIVAGRGPFKIQRRGHPRSLGRKRKATLERVRHLMNGGVGTEFRVFDRRGKPAVYGCRVVEYEPPTPVPSLGCAPELERIHGSVWQRFGKRGIWSAGRWYCRYIDGTWTVSRHGYRGRDWYGAAEDIGARTMDDLRDIASHIVTETNAGRLRARQVIVANVAWTVGVGWRRYYGNYHYHVHCEVDGGWQCDP